MKKIFKNTLLSIVCALLLGLCINVNAAGVAKIGDTEYATVQAAIDAATDGQTVVLLADRTETLTVDGKDMTLDLGGNELTVDGWGIDVYDSTLTVTNGTINSSGNVGVYLNSGNTFTLDSSAKITGAGTGITSDLYPASSTNINKSVIKGEINVSGTAIWVDNESVITVNDGAKLVGNDGIVLGSESAASKLTVNGYVQGSNVAITINGLITSSSECPTITVGSNAQIVANGDETVALYLAGYGKTTIADGAKLTGEASAVEIRAGELTINGGTFTSTHTGSVTVTPNGNGSTTVGAALAIAQHTTKQHIKVKVNGGTFNGVAAIYESNPQNNESVSNDVELEVVDGTFTATGDKAVYSEDKEEFVSGGTFTPEVDSKYVVQNKIEYKIDDDTMAIGEPVVGLVINEKSEETVSDTELNLIKDALPEGFSIGSLYEVDYGTHKPSPDNSMLESVEEIDHAVKITLSLPKNLPALAKGFTRIFKVIRIHNGKVTVLDATDNGNGTVSCYSDKFSTYAVVYNDTENAQNREASSSESKKVNPATGDRILIFALLLAIGLSGGAITIKKLANR